MEKELINFILEIESLTTSEFCKKYDIELPSWKGIIEVATIEFLRLDAIKWRMVKDKAKELNSKEYSI